jgi:hypothetical protein
VHKTKALSTSIHLGSIEQDERWSLCYRDVIGVEIESLDLMLGIILAHWHSLEFCQASNASPCSCDSSKLFLYPNHVGSFRISHRRFGNPNGSYASLRWTNHPSSIDTILVEFWLRNVTIWTIVTLMSLWPTSIANTTFNLTYWSLALIFAHLLLLGPVACCRSLIALDMLLRRHCCQNRSNRFPKSVRPVWCR